MWNMTKYKAIILVFHVSWSTFDSNSLFKGGTFESKTHNRYICLIWERSAYCLQSNVPPQFPPIMVAVVGRFEDRGFASPCLSSDPPLFIFVLHDNFKFKSFILANSSVQLLKSEDWFSLSCWVFCKMIDRLTASRFLKLFQSGKSSRKLAMVSKLH